MFHPIDLQGWEQRDTFTHFMQAGCVVLQVSRIPLSVLYASA